MPQNNNINKVKYPLYIEGDYMEDPNLGFYEAGLLAMIEVFDKDENHCYATNQFFAARLRVSTRTVTRLISSLEAKGYIRIISKNYYMDKKYTRRIAVVRNLHYEINEGGVILCQ